MMMQQIAVFSLKNSLLKMSTFDSSTCSSPSPHRLSLAPLVCRCSVMLHLSPSPLLFVFFLLLSSLSSCCLCSTASSDHPHPNSNRISRSSSSSFLSRLLPWSPRHGQSVAAAGLKLDNDVADRLFPFTIRIATHGEPHFPYVSQILLLYH